MESVQAKFWNLKNVTASDDKQNIYDLHVLSHRIQRAFICVLLSVGSYTLAFPLFQKSYRLPMGTCTIGNGVCLIYYILENICIFTASFYLSALDSIYIGLCISVATQFKIVADYLRNIDHINTPNGAMINIKGFVDHHDLLFRYLQLLLKYLRSNIINEYNMF